MAVDTDLFPPRYRGPQQIARGGMGEIYRATDSTLGRAVAIKILAERYAKDAAVRERFTREALAAARLSGDRNTVTIYDVGEHNGRPYIVMEYLGGGSLDDVLRKEGGQPPERAFMWLEEAGRALDAAHREGVVHRDVKPANLMLDREGTVHVADFGIASAAGLDSLTMTGTVLGTAGYLSPEQAQGERATPASDRYGLGIVAYELLTGKRPFQADSPTAEASAHVNAPVPSVCDMSSLPCELDPVFQKALAKEPNERYDSCAEFVAALRAAMADAAGATRELTPVAVTAPAPYPPRPRASAWPLLALLLVAGIVAGVLAAYFLTRDGGTGREAGATVITRERTVTRAGQVTTVERPVTVTTSSPSGGPPSSTANPGASGAALNDAGFEKQQAGDYEDALPLLEQAVGKLRATGSITEAYASYNLAYTRFQLGRCDGVLALLDRSESIQGHRTAIDSLRRQARATC
jgi:eukaryotic-like serine/threonine-protein kinase